MTRALVGHLIDAVKRILNEVFQAVHLSHSESTQHFPTVDELLLLTHSPCVGSVCARLAMK